MQFILSMKKIVLVTEKLPSKTLPESLKNAIVLNERYFPAVAAPQRSTFCLFPGAILTFLRITFPVTDTVQKIMYVKAVSKSV